MGRAQRLIDERDGIGLAECRKSSEGQQQADGRRLREPHGQPCPNAVKMAHEMTDDEILTCSFAEFN